MSNLSPSRWLLNNCLGGVAGLVAGAVLLPLTMLLGFGVGLGGVVGLFQSAALNRRPLAEGPRVNRAAWAAVSAGAGALPGWLLGFALIMGASNGGAPVRDALAFSGELSGAVALFGGVSAAVCGGLAGLVQGAMLRAGRERAGAIVGWAVASAVGWGVSWAAQGGGLALLLTGHNAGGLAGAAITALGAALVLGGWAPYALLTAPILQTWASEPGAPGAAGLPTAP